MQEIKSLAAAAARYSSENVELRVALQEVEKRIYDIIIKSDYPDDDLLALQEYVKRINENK